MVSRLARFYFMAVKCFATHILFYDTQKIKFGCIPCQFRFSTIKSVMNPWWIKSNKCVHLLLRNEKLAFTVSFLPSFVAVSHSWNVNFGSYSNILYVVSCMSRNLLCGSFELCSFGIQWCPLVDWYYTSRAPMLSIYCVLSVNVNMRTMVRNNRWLF